MKLDLAELAGKSQEELLEIANQVSQLKKARRVKLLDGYLQTMHHGQEEFHRNKKRIRYVWAGNRCLRESTKIWTNEGLKEIGSITSNLSYLSRNPLTGKLVFSEGSVPFVKDKAQLYRVVHKHGEFFASAGHKIQRINGMYSSIEEIIQESEFGGITCFKTPVGLTQILAIEKQPQEEWYWDLSVLDTNNYIDESGVVHHNSGKTTSGFVEHIWHVTGTHPFVKGRVPIKSAIVGPDFTNWAQSVLEPKLNEWTPPNYYRKIDRHQNGAIKRIYWTCGSTTDVFSHDQDPMVYEGNDFDLVWFDEPPPQYIYKALWRSCVDRGGRMYMTGTPLMSPWLYKVYQQIKDNKDPIRWYIKFNSRMNAKNIGGGDEALGLQRLDELASEYTEEEKAARLDGEFLQLQGLVFKNWDRQLHCIDKFPIPHSWPIYESIDPHPNKPWAVTWTAIAPNNSKILLQSLYFEGVIDEIANQIIYARGRLQIKDNMKPKIIRSLIDNASSVPLWQKSAFNNDPMARRVSVREELENMIGPRGAGGPKVEVCPKNVAQKIDVLKSWLHVKERGKVKRPDFFVMLNGETDDFIEEIENYVWDRYKARGGGDLKAAPVKKNDDLLDSVMQVGLVLGVKVRDTDAEPISLIDGLSTYGGNNESRTIQKRRTNLDWQD